MVSRLSVVPGGWIGAAFALAAALCTAPLVVALPAAADTDVDGDGIEDLVDDCPHTYNPLQQSECTAVAPLTAGVGEAPPAGGVTILYDVDFGTPPHTVGLAPVVGDGPLPRDTVSRISFGDPTVVAAYGAMDDQPLLLQANDPDPSAPFDYQQLYWTLSSTYLAPLPEAFTTLHIEFTLMIDEQLTDGLTFFLDAPRINSLRFTSQGLISVFVPFGTSGVIGNYQLGVPMRVVIDADGIAEEWSIAIDGQHLYSGFLSGVSDTGELRAARISASGISTVLVDDLLIADGPLPEIDIELDVRPFSTHETVYMPGYLPLAAALLGSDSIDVADIDLASIQFGPAGAQPISPNPHYFDVNGDSIDDLLMAFKRSETGLQVGDTEACIEGELSGVAFASCDEVIVAEGCGHGYEAALVLLPVMWMRRRLSCNRNSGPQTG